MIAQHAHEVRLSGTQLPGVGDLRPVILKRKDQSFIAAILDDLRLGETGFNKLSSTIAVKAPDLNLLKLYQPVHRIFYVGMFEVTCRYFKGAAFPRLDAADIDSCGLVIRRIAENDQGGLLRDHSGSYIYEAWQQDNNQILGWVRLNNDRGEPDMDPDPAYRPVFTLGDTALDERLPLARRIANTRQESISPLFTAPSDVCESSGKTVLYGVLPLTSSEVSEVLPPVAFDPAFVATHMPLFLQQGGPRTLPNAGYYVNHFLADDKSLTTRQFMLMLQQVVIEFDALGSTPSARALFAELNTIRLPLDPFNTQTIPAGDLIADAAPILLEREGANESSPPTIQMPYYWPAIDERQALRLQTRVQAAMETQLAALHPGEGKFTQANRRYVIRAFARVKQPDDCPPLLVWSEVSELFTIAPWHETGDQPPVQVTLPNPFDRNVLRNLKPNVAFVMPDSLFNFLNNMDGAAILEGNGERPEDTGFELDWICGFNIPIITICAFILLFIILSLLNIIFWWLPFIKICIPFPKITSGNS